MVLVLGMLVRRKSCNLALELHMQVLRRMALALRTLEHRMVLVRRKSCNLALALRMLVRRMALALRTLEHRMVLVRRKSCNLEPVPVPRRSSTLALAQGNLHHTVQRQRR